MGTFLVLQQLDMTWFVETQYRPALSWMEKEEEGLGGGEGRMEKGVGMGGWEERL